ncbi:dolichyl-diphosphooligosaccharide--protein glycosyltransferase subunit 1 [Tulasnella sp. JGI-2019a]|nr:dolichyl-diphosphooligosaccharide--protein glycosyltransferase subunit 1 [Tulasnella sp. JGI-2019a]
MHLARPWTSALQLCSLLSLALASDSLAFSPPINFENTAIVRSVDLGGATTQVTTTYQVRALKDGSQQYFFTLSAGDAARTSWMEAKLKGGSSPLKLESTHAADNVFLYGVTLPKPLKVNETATLALHTLQSHASTPLPATIRQSEPLYLKYESDLYILSSYNTVIQRLKLRTPTQKVKEYSSPSSSKYASGDSMPYTKSATTVTYGPFRGVPSWTDATFQNDAKEQVTVHYELDSPYTTIKTLKRAAEISHWGSNLNIQDNIWLKNEGARLKGHFSRLEHIKQKVHTGTSQPHVLTDLVLHLPSGVRDPYIYDVIGNVSTSKFRPALPRRQTASSLSRLSPLERPSLLEMKPRYPLMGGWNYTFTMGYDLPLQEWAGYDQEKGAYVVAVPFLTPLPGATFDDVETKIILPEGAKLLEHRLPFPVDSEQEDKVLTYLDSVGRPSISFRKFNCTNEHAGMIYIVYSVDAKAHMQKPFTVAAAAFGVFMLAMSLRRLDFTIHSHSHSKKLV